VTVVILTLVAGRWSLVTGRSLEKKEEEEGSLMRYLIFNGLPCLVRITNYYKL
jgi:hypothetical protein